MPTYEYECRNHSCKDGWEEWQSITAPVTEYCPTCGERTAARLISSSAHDGFILSGWGSGGAGPLRQFVCT